jgi:hypothetical protein
MDLGTPVATKLLGGAALLAIAGLGWSLVVGPETATLTEVQQQVVDTRDQNDVLGLQLATLRQQEEQLGETRRTALRLAKRFPATADQPGLFEAVTAAAVDAGIGADGVTTLSPTPPQVGGADAVDPATGAPAVTPGATPGAGDLARQSVTVTVAGGYDETLRLLENLEHIPRAYLVATVSVSADGERGYSTTVIGDMFVMPPLTDPGATQQLATTSPPSGG